MMSASASLTAGPTTFEFLETQVASPVSKLTLGNLFDSYDQSKVHSKPSVSWDLFLGGAERGRERLMMDFFGDVQGVEVEPVGNNAGNGCTEDLIWLLKEIVRRREEERILSDENNVAPGLPEEGKHCCKNLSSAQ